DYLGLAWRQLQVNARTRYFEDQSDELRRYAVAAMSEIGEVRTPLTDDRIVDVLRVFHYGNPKVLLAVAALRSATLGQVPRLTILSADEMRQIQPDVPIDMEAPSLVDPKADDERVRRIFDDIAKTLGLSVISCDYRSLAGWPEYLDGVWQAMKLRIHTPQYRRAVRELRRMADGSVLDLPFRMDITPHILRNGGLTEAQIDMVRAALDLFYRVVPDLVMNMAIAMTGVEGRTAAMESPFPVSSGD
ncbi:MAG TPA: hypothetical protein VF221_09995, partial [Chloroflexota bacterium]